MIFPINLILLILSVTLLSCSPFSNNIKSYGDRQVDLVLPLNSNTLYAELSIKHYFYLNQWYYKAEINVLADTVANVSKIELIREGAKVEIPISKRYPIQAKGRTQLLIEKIEISMNDELLKSLTLEPVLDIYITGQYNSGQIILKEDSLNLIRKYIYEIEKRHLLEANWRIIQYRRDIQ